MGGIGTDGDSVVRTEFFFDPGCPWTWRTACWLRRTGTPAVWRAFRLELTSDDPLPEAWRAAAAASRRALRLVEQLAAAGRHDDAGRFYEALGVRAHEGLEPFGGGMVDEVAAAVGLDGADVAALDDPSLDDAVRAAFEEARALTGPDLGSPVLALTFADGRRRGVFGPILTGDPSDAEVAHLWDATVAFLRIDQVAELKRGRSLHGTLHPSLTPHV